MTEWKAEMRPEWQDCPSCNGCNNYEVEAILTRANEELTKVRAERDAALARVRDLTEWRPMSEAPQGYGSYLLLQRDGSVAVGFSRCAAEFRESVRTGTSSIGWVPLPEPPKEGA